MSTNVTAAGMIFADLNIVARMSRRGSGRPTTPTLGSAPPGWRAASALLRVSALNSVLLPTFGTPTMPMVRPTARQSTLRPGPAPLDGHVRIPRATRARQGQDRGVDLDFEHCYRAVASRDSRFDGWFFTAVTSTGIYCRPSCPSLTPKRRNVRFYASAAAAQRNGFRACRRCRPDAAPGSPEWDVRADVVGRAMRLIGDGVVDRDGVPGLARRLGYTQRHLHRMLTAELGAGPLALARAQRAQTARVLIETTDLGLAEIAFASGFGSVRQFNDTIQEVFGQPPSALRARRPAARAEPGTISLRLAYRAPLHVE